MCMITHSFYESDNRVLRYAEALAAQGCAVEVLSLRRNPEMPKTESLSGVVVHRIQDRFGKKERAKASFLWPILKFLFASSWWLTRAHCKQRYHFVHVHNVPDFLVFAAWLPKITGARIILDIHDIVPEFFGSKFGVPETSATIRGLKLAEKISAKFANHIILANHLWLDKYTARSANPQKCSVFINNVDAEIFKPLPTQKPGHDKQVILFPGGLQWHQGLDIAIRAFHKLQHRLPRAEFHIYGDGNMKAELVELVQTLGLNDRVHFFNPRPIKQIAEVMAAADLGVVPKRADSFGNEAYSTKIMEFMSVGVPVVVSRTQIDRYYFNDSVVRFFESGNVDDLAEAMFEVLTNGELRSGLIARAREYAADNSWENRRGDYLQLVDSLLAKMKVPKVETAMQPTLK